MHLPTIGIDFGTTNSRVGVFRNGNFEIIENNYGYRVTPSIVTINGNGLVGDAAKNQMTVNPTNTITNFRQKNDWQLITPILSYLKTIAGTHLHGVVENAVITVPTCFNRNQRTKIENTGRQAGLKLTLLNESLAAAIAYGVEMRSDEKKTIMVYDMGSGYLDVAIVTIQNKVFQVLATSGDPNLGGNDFDDKLIEFVSSDIKRTINLDISTGVLSIETSRALCLLREACETAKKRLSFETSTLVTVEELNNGEDYTKRINSARFESLCRDLFDRVLIPVEQALIGARMSKHQIDEVVLVGGSTRIPKIQKLLSEFFDGKTLSKSVDTDEAVIRGAAIWAAAIDKRVDVQLSESKEKETKRSNDENKRPISTNQPQPTDHRVPIRPAPTVDRKIDTNLQYDIPPAADFGSSRNDTRTPREGYGSNPTDTTNSHNVISHSSGFGSRMNDNRSIPINQYQATDSRAPRRQAAPDNKRSGGNVQSSEQQASFMGSLRKLFCCCC